MMLTEKAAVGVAAGSVTLAFRDWTVARVRPGDQFLTTAGRLAVTEVSEVPIAQITEEDARASGVSSKTALLRSFRGATPESVFRIGLMWVGPDPREALSLDASIHDADRAQLTAQLARLDQRSATGPWTREALETIRDRPGVPADAIRGNLSKVAFKRNVRTLRNLGLTLSLAVGYELSPRGDAYLTQMDDHDDEMTT